MELSKKQLAGIVTMVALVAGVSAGILTYDEDYTYYCEARDVVAHCNRLSSTTKSCYYLDDDGEEHSYRCTSGWVPIAGYVELDKERYGKGDTGVTYPCSKYAYKRVCRLD